MKRKQICLFLAMAVVTSVFLGCGNDKNDGVVADTEEIAATEKVVDNTENVAESTENTNQLQLGSAVEIPAGFNGTLAEDTPHGQIESVIAEYYNIPQENWENTRYYYNYVDLNGDSQKEILAMVVQGEMSSPKAARDVDSTGKTKSVSSEVEKINETEMGVPLGGTEAAATDALYTLLWIDAGNDEMKKEHVRQEFVDIKAPVYISNHMTGGYRDLIVCESNGGTQEKSYRLMIWDGSKYTDSKQLGSLEGYEGDAILTNNMEPGSNTEDYHFLGKGVSE